MKFAYADPPYLGCCSKYKHYHPDGRCWDDIETHKLLIERLVNDYPEGWAMSLHSVSLNKILPLCPDACRVGAWTKPFAAFRPNVNPGYCWEPVIYFGGRKRDRYEPTVRDYCAVNIAMKKGLTGAKPEKFSHWMFSLLGARPGDEFHDLFSGTGLVMQAWHTYCQSLSEVKEAC